MDSQTGTAEPVRPDDLADGQPADEVDELDDGVDEEFAPSQRAGLGRLTVGLLAGIALVAAFGAGAYVQKHNGSSTSTVAGPRAGGGAFTRGEGAPSGFGGAFPGAGTGTTTGGGTTTGSGTTSAAPAVIGIVVKVSGNQVTLKNFAGKTVTVTVPDGVTVTKSSTVALKTLGKGDALTVVGTTKSDGSVTATAVTAR